MSPPILSYYTIADVTTATNLIPCHLIADTGIARTKNCFPLADIDANNLLGMGAGGGGDGISGIQI